MNPVINAGQFKGLYKLVVRDGKTMEVKRETPWFDNLITDIGLNRIGTGGIGIFAVVGSGSNPPAFTDTSMQSVVAATTTVTSTLIGTQSTQPYFGWTRRTYRFPIGTAAGNLSEVGIAWDGGGTYSVFSRALILDPLGDPTTMTVLSDEVLDVSYELRLFPPVGDQSFNITIAGVTYAVVMRAGSLTTNTAWTSLALFSSGMSIENPYTMASFDGPIGSLTTGPSGTVSFATANVKAAYSNNSLKITTTSTWDLSVGNYATGITAFSIIPNGSSLGGFQAGFSPSIPKDATKILTITFDVSWARKV